MDLIATTGCETIEDAARPCPSRCPVARHERTGIEWQRDNHTLGTKYTEWGDSFQSQTLSNGTKILYEGSWNGSGSDRGLAVAIPVGDVPVQVSAGLKVSGATENGYMWILDSAEQRDAEQQVRGALARDLYMHGGHVPDFSNPDWVHNETLYQYYYDAFRHQNVDRVVTKVSKTGQVSLSADALGASAELEVGVGANKTVEQDRNGTKVITYEVEGEAAGAIGALMQGEKYAGVQGKYTVSVSMEPSGEVSGVDITAIESVKWGQGGGFNAAHVESAGETIEEALKKGAQSTVRGALSELSVGVAATAKIVDRDAATHALRETVHIDARAAGVDRRALAELVAAPNAQNVHALTDSLTLGNTSLDVQLYGGEEHTEGAELKVQLNVGLGVGESTTQRKLNLVDAWSLSSHGAQHRTDCVP